MKIFFTLCLFLITSLGFSQNLTLTAPSGLSEPYEVAYGTVVTVEWDYFETEPTYMFTYDQFPGSNLNSEWQFFVNSDWTSGSGWTDNGDGTYSWDVTINEDTWIFGAFNVFSGNSYSNVIQVSVASDVVISYEDGLICSSGGSEVLSVEGTYSDFQWYKDDVLIDGATSSSYTATAAGTYYLIADGTQSNSLNVENLSISFSGELSMEGTELTLSATEGMDTYQWYSGTEESSMTAISGATSSVYVATLQSELTYYHVVGTLDICEVVSENRSANLQMFTAPLLTMNADSNAFNHVCVGSPITLSIDENTQNFTWYRNNFSTYYTTTSITITNIYSTGMYNVIVGIDEWPEIEVQSNSINATYYELISPVLTGVTNSVLHCAGENITIDLSDEGYDYTWYAHDGINYDETNIVEGVTTTYSFVFENAIRITVVGEFQGCQTATTIYLNSYANQTLYISPSNYDQQYLCTDSVANLTISASTAANYTDFQWLHKNGSVWEEITDANAYSYAAPDSGFYKLRATSINCSTAIIESNEYHVKHYSERSLNLYVDQPEMCLGDTATLNMYSLNWTAIQWHKGDIQITDSGYELVFIPISGAGNQNYQDVYEFNTYLVKAKHNSCPNGLKIKSNQVQVKPSLNPNIIIDMDVYSYQLALWDSAIFYLSCNGTEIDLSVEEGFDTYQWYDQLYSGLGNYDLPGNVIIGANSDTLSTTFGVQWITAEVSLDGCIGYSDPILLDTWAFLDPAIASYNNNIICEEGDSAMINVAFQGPWIEYYWLQSYDGILDTVPNSNNDTLWVTEPGEYIVFAYPEQCPNTVFTSGVGPYMDFLEAIIMEATDDDGTEYFYAFPWQGFFDYQWFIDGEPYDNPSSVPSVLLKEGLPAGEITVEVTSLPDLCVDMSEPVSWNPVGIDENSMLNFIVFPNPTNSSITISGIDPLIVESAVIFNTQGKIMMTFGINSENHKIDISSFPKGIYVLRILDKEGNVYAKTLNKL